MPRKNTRLKEARVKANLTQLELAEKLGYKGKQSVANWENGHSKPTLGVEIKIAEILSKDVGFLFGPEVQDSHTEEVI